MISDRINEQSTWQELTEGNKVYEAATAREFKTGDRKSTRLNSSHRL